MPSTITAFYSFSVGQKARSSEVNTNFSNVRGTFLPINENTASASDMSHDLGAETHRWSVAYLGSIDLGGATTTANVIVRAQSGVTAGAVETVINGSTVSNLGFGEFGFIGNTSTNYTKFKYQSGVTAGAIDLLMGSTTLGTWTTSGLKHRTKAPMEYTSTSAPVGVGVMSGLTNMSSLATGTTICTSRITTVGGGGVLFSWLNSSLRLNASGGGTTTGLRVGYEFSLYRGTTTTSLSLLFTSKYYCTIVGGTTPEFASPLAMNFMDTGYSAGEVCYELRCSVVTASASGILSSLTGAYFIKEL